MAGAAQATIALAGAGMSGWWLVLLAGQWSRDGYFPIDGGEDFRLGVGGVLVFGVAWAWSLATSLSVIRAARGRG